MARIYRDADADLGELDGRTVAIIGYGNQGRSQALNLRDSGVQVIVGSPSDGSAARAQDDGFSVLTVAEAAQQADIIFLLVPDEVMRSVYEEDVGPGLQDGNVLNFAHGYNIAYGLIVPPSTVDVTLLGPRMIGKGVRDTFVNGTGFPSLIAVGQDATGKAWRTLLALARGIGSTAMGAVSSTFEEETYVDLFSEQCGDLVMLRAMFEVLTEAGIDPDVAILEMYGSGELSEIYAEARDMGMLGQLHLHSRTSQYGQQVVGPRHIDIAELKKSLNVVFEGIRNGTFAQEFEREQRSGLRSLWSASEASLRHPMQVAEDHLYTALGRRQEPLTNWIEAPEAERTMS